jgi:hypothetical protein
MNMARATPQWRRALPPVQCNLVNAATAQGSGFRDDFLIGAVPFLANNNPLAAAPESENDKFESIVL